MGWECFCVVGFDRGPLLQGRTRILHLQYFFKYVLTYSLHLNSYLVTFLHNTICRAKLFCPFLLSVSEFLLNMLFNYQLLYFCTALSLIIMLSYHYYLHKSKTLSQLTQHSPLVWVFLTMNWCKPVKNKHSDACIYLPPYKLDVLKIVEYKFSCEMEAHVEVTTSLMFDCNTFKDKRHLLTLVAVTLPSKELQFCNFIMQ